MRITILYLLLISIFFKCKLKDSVSTPSDLKNYTWGTRTSTVLENGYYHSNKSLDTAANQLTGDTLIPVKSYGSNLIIQKLEPLRMEPRSIDGIEDFYITQVGFKSDTFMYDVKKYAGNFFLVLISPNSGSHVFELKDKNIQLSETNNITSPRYEIEGYTIGDVILRKDINVLYTDQFGSTLTEEATLLNNENILLKIIAGKYIEEIRRLNISETDAQKIFRDLNKAFTLPPDIEYGSEVSMNQTGEILQYYWSENEENILLTKVTETGELDNVWTLTYTNLILSNIINNYIENPEDIL